MLPLGLFDLLALGWFLLAWGTYGRLVDSSRWRSRTLTARMEAERRRWMQVMTTRDLRVIDTGIMAGLQSGTAFFASTSLLALGAAFALLNQTDRLLEVFGDLPYAIQTTRPALELKIIGLAVIYAYAFFKFGWSYRLFNYASVLLGAVPMPGRAPEAEALIAADRAAEMQTIAGRHFNWGLRAFFFSIGFLGWFAGPGPFVVTTTFIVVVLARRQFSSSARMAVLGREAARSLKPAETPAFAAQSPPDAGRASLPPA